MSLDDYRTLGRSGLRVSAMALGTMTFGTEWGWGSDPQEARRVFDAYVDLGGNFIDTANQYTNGAAEGLLGQFVEGRREALVLATKYGMLRRLTDPNSGGNHRKSMLASVEASMRRLRTDYLDLLYLHMWDGLTPVEEILRGLDDLVRAGKVLYVGISNVPAWQVARMQAVADLRGWSPLVALQVEYSLIERTPERELIPMAREMGLGVVGWSPLAGGVLSGKYTSAAPGTGSTRRDLAIANGSLTQRGLAIAEVVRKVAAELGRPVSQVALAWVSGTPVIPIIGARTHAQLRENLGALELTLDEEQLAELDRASAVEHGFPHDFLARPLAQSSVFGDMRIAGRPTRRWSSRTP